MLETYSVPLHLKNKVKKFGYDEIDRHKFNWWKVLGWIILISLAVIGFLALCVYFFPNLEAKEIISPAIWKVLLAEGANQGYEGMYAIACVVRNRGGELDGFAGAHRKDLDAFCNRQGKRYIEMAKRIETIVFKNNGKDITNGATHFENEKAFGVPYWAKKMDRVTVIGSHVFYKARSK